MSSAAHNPRQPINWAVPPNMSGQISSRVIDIDWISRLVKIWNNQSNEFMYSENQR